MTLYGVNRLLVGVVVDTTAISNVVPETNSLTYRGFPVQELAASCSFEEVAYLVWHGELPDADALRRFCTASGRFARSPPRPSRSSSVCLRTATRWTCCAPP